MFFKRKNINPELQKKVIEAEADQMQQQEAVSVEGVGDEGSEGSADALKEKKQQEQAASNKADAPAMT